MMRSRRKLPLKYLKCAWLQSTNRFEREIFHRAGYVSHPKAAAGDSVEGFFQTVSMGLGKCLSQSRVCHTTLRTQVQSLASMWKLRIVMYDCIPSTGETKTGIYLGLTGKPAQPIQGVQGQVRDPVSANKVNTVWGTTPKTGLWCPHNREQFCPWRWDRVWGIRCG